MLSGHQNVLPNEIMIEKDQLLIDEQCKLHSQRTDQRHYSDHSNKTIFNVFLGELSDNLANLPSD